jgi:uncharacterized protein (TIGR02594 family)
MSDPFQIAAKQLGMNERDQNAALSEFLANGGVNLDPAVTAWCAAYVNASLSQAGVKGTGSNMARDFLKWGQEVAEPQRGDIAVFQRGDPNGPYGHVGFFDGYNEDGTIRVLGGNQGDGVSYANYGADKLLGFRRAPGEAGQAPGNALAGYAQEPEPQNALAKPELQLIDTRLDPAAFMNRPRRNALAIG